MIVCSFLEAVYLHGPKVVEHSADKINWRPSTVYKLLAKSYKRQ
jgi:hypothetical protein